LPAGDHLLTALTSCRGTWQSPIFFLKGRRWQNTWIGFERLKKGPVLDFSREVQGKPSLLEVQRNGTQMYRGLKRAFSLTWLQTALEI
jgi:hypothetical protein